jgi:hypothetical protein
VSAVVETGAVLSPDGKYRYRLWRRWDPKISQARFIMLNPSTADANTDDPTIKKCMKFARSWGCGGIEVVNLFAYRATNPKALKPLTCEEAVGPWNDEILFEVLRNKGGINIAAWGQNGKLFGRAAAVGWELDKTATRLYALKLAKDGTPYHPLYLKDETKAFLWRA